MSEFFKTYGPWEKFSPEDYKIIRRIGTNELRAVWLAYLLEGRHHETERNNIVRNPN